MSDDIVSFDINEGHVYFSVRAFNRAWDYIEQGDQRSTEEDLTMLHTAMASLWHWTQREDVNPKIYRWDTGRSHACLIYSTSLTTHASMVCRH